MSEVTDNAANYIAYAEAYLRKGMQFQQQHFTQGVGHLMNLLEIAESLQADKQRLEKLVAEMRDGNLECNETLKAFEGILSENQRLADARLLYEAAFRSFCKIIGLDENASRDDVEARLFQLQQQISELQVKNHDLAEMVTQSDPFTYCFTHNIPYLKKGGSCSACGEYYVESGEESK